MWLLETNVRKCFWEEDLANLPLLDTGSRDSGSTLDVTFSVKVTGESSCEGVAVWRDSRKTSGR